MDLNKQNKGLALGPGFNKYSYNTCVDVLRFVL